MKAIRKMKENEDAVSPVVATLVLIVVAVVGAVAVGTIMGAFSGDVSDEMSAGDVAGSAQTEVLISGSTTVQPASELIAKEYMKDNTGVKVTVMGGGSDAGLSAINLKVVDIGAASKTASATTYPDLVGYKIGGSAVVVICNEGATALTNVAKDDLIKTYRDSGNGTALAGITSVYERSEGSGTEETFAKYINAGSSLDTVTPASGVTKVPASGNAGILAGVKATEGSIGFVDVGYLTTETLSASGLEVLGIVETGYTTTNAIDSTTFKTLQDNIKAALKGTALKYPNSESNGLTRPLMYYTNGDASGIVKDYIQFAMSPAGQTSVNAAGMFHIIDIS